jgi:hypothetical protein
MTNQDPKQPPDDLLSPDLEALLIKGFVVVPKGFDALITKQLPTATRSNLLLKIASFCRLCALAMTGALASTEVIAFVFSFWAAGAAL